jgi:hypothetical protein
MFLEFLNNLLFSQADVAMAFFDPASLAVMGGSALLGGVQAHLKKKAADEAERKNREQSSLDTEYSPFVKTKGYQMAVHDAGPGVLGGAFQGALSGYNQGQLNKQAGMKDDIYAQLLAQMKQGK